MITFDSTFEIRQWWLIELEVDDAHDTVCFHLPSFATFNKNVSKTLLQF